MPPYIYKYLRTQNLVADRREMMAFPLTSEVLDQVMCSDPFTCKYLCTSTIRKAENKFKVNPPSRARQHKNTQNLILWLSHYW